MTPDLVAALHGNTPVQTLVAYTNSGGGPMPVSGDTLALTKPTPAGDQS